MAEVISAPHWATCRSCEQVMAPGAACTQGEYKLNDGKTYARVPYPADAEGNCHDCNVLPGTRHHPGCDAERCPKCHDQLIGCNC
jgi:hypothetical protein